MNQEEIFTSFTDILQDLGDVDPTAVALDSALRTDLDVDSLLMVEVVIAAEDRFGVAIPDDEVSSLQTVGDVVRHISRQFAPA